MLNKWENSLIECAILIDGTLQKVVTKNTGWQINVMAKNGGRAHHAMLVETLDQTSLVK